MLNIVILAAGKGKRMFSDLPKVLQPLAGAPLLHHIITTARALSPAGIYVVYGHQGDLVKETISDSDIHWIHQKEQAGTAHAVAQALPYLNDESITLVLYGDVPLVPVSTLQALYRTLPENSLSLLVANVDDPTGLGRVIRNTENQIVGIVEEKDATSEQRNIDEIYSGIMVTHTKQLRQWLKKIDNNNSQQEYYLTSIPAFAIADGCLVNSVFADSPLDIMGVNTKNQLALLERRFQLRQADKLMEQGVTLRDPARFDLRGTLHAGRDVMIDVGVILEGEITLGDRVKIGAHSVLRNVNVADDVVIKENCVIEDSIIGSHCMVGPFSRLRPDAQLASHVHIGNFVEVKKSVVGEGSKINHLTYIGDAEIGERVNIGAGTITCNYDGVNKHKTTIGNGAFIGSNTSLVAPIMIGEEATIGAGSTVSKATPANQLTVARARQVTITGWERPKKKEKD
ncbi:MAG: bifunctional UDP-N-acetylglucosamine diphosphorylase/glucosamine-1-phosphate N-acetyltransferase GlmU [Legionellales bacterium]|nr:bifunctional UDP-N-acetylglucosamine diphosphorylase/glucosamine-1-phosphate N-acetyltransferase GlmU [Legionellales bacterium]